MRKNQNGFTILEVFISLVIGLILFGGILSVFVGMKTTTKETASMGELQENGHFAIAILTDDLLRQNFWGDLNGILSAEALTVPAPLPPAGDCSGDGLNNGSFPQSNTSAFRTLWAENITNASILGGCITDAVLNSDVIQIKRVIAEPIINLPADLNATRFYLNAGSSSAAIFAGDEAIPAINASRVWEYQHHIYYVREDNVGNSGEVVPVLMQGRLQNTDNVMSFNLLIEGIEKVHYMFGVDTSGDGIINGYLSSEDMLDDYWDSVNGIRILAVKLYVLVRAIRADNQYENNNIYQLGDITFNANGDNYRRLLFSSTVSLYNGELKKW